MQRDGDALYSADAEMSVLGGMFIDADAIDEVADVITERHFYAEKHKEIFRALRAIHDEGSVADAVTLAAKLQDWGSYDRIGGAPFLARLLDAVPTASNIRYHAEVIRNKAHLRKLRQIGVTLSELAITGKPADEVQDEAERLVYEAGDGMRQVDDALEHVKVGMLEALARMEKNEPDVLSGFQVLDWQTQGFARGDLVILAARPSMGKTALAIQMALNAAMARDEDVAVFSLEMQRDAICRRLMFTEACVDGMKFRRDGATNQEDNNRLSRASALIASLPMYITSRTSTVVQMRGHLRRLGKQTGRKLKLVVIDYLGKMRGTGRTDNRVHELGEITGDLKAMAIEMDCPVVLLCQLSRAVEARTDKRPMLSDLRDSGEIEQDADTVLMLYRPEYYEGPTDKNGNTLQGVAEVNIAKQRNGKTGKVELRFFPEYTRFEDPKP